MTGKKILATRQRYMLYDRAGLTEAQMLLKCELDCREAINRCIVYYGTERGQEAFWTEIDGFSGQTMFSEKLGKDRVEELVKEQLADIARSKIYRDAYIDENGYTRCGIKWPDEFIPELI